MEDMKEQTLLSHGYTAIKTTDDIEDLPTAGSYTMKEGHTSRLHSFLCYLLLLNVMFLVSTVTIITMSNGPSVQTQESYSPAQRSVYYTLHKHHVIGHSKYSAFSGPPNAENNKAWEDLIQPTYFSIADEEIRRLNDTVEDSVELAAGGRLAALGIYHELHCLRRLRLFVYKEIYYPHLTEENIDYLHEHMDHCLETLRVSLMCKANLSVYTFRWEPSADPDRPLPKSNSDRKCVDWSSLEKWAYSRKVGLRPTLLRETGEAEVIHM